MHVKTFHHKTTAHFKAHRTNSKTISPKKKHVECLTTNFLVGHHAASLPKNSHQKVSCLTDQKYDPFTVFVMNDSSETNHLLWQNAQPWLSRKGSDPLVHRRAPGPTFTMKALYRESVGFHEMNMRINDEGYSTQLPKTSNDYIYITIWIVHSSLDIILHNLV